MSPSRHCCGVRCCLKEQVNGGEPRSYNHRTVQTPLAFDTSGDIEQRQIESWRAMSPREKADIVSALTAATFELALAGVRHRHPEATQHEQFLRLALVTLGPDLARRVYPDIDRLSLA